MATAPVSTVKERTHEYAQSKENYDGSKEKGARLL